MPFAMHVIVRAFFGESAAAAVVALVIIGIGCGQQVDVEIGKDGNDGMLVTQGGRFGGWGLFVLDGKPQYVYNVCNLERYRVASDTALTPGKHTIRYEFKYDGGGPGKGGSGTLFVDGKQVAAAKIKRTMGFRISLDETFDIGSDAGEPVSEDYHVPFDFKGKLKKVVVKLEP